jgi:flagellar biogenesis protein FliO
MDSIQSLLAVLFVLGLLGATLLMLRRRALVQWRMPARAPLAERRMQVIEKMTLGPHHALHLVRIGEKSVLVATTPTSCQVLDGRILNQEETTL